MENVLQQNFVAIWHHFLSFEISRSKLGVETWGSGNAYLIFQVIAWHHILVMSDQAESKIRDEAVELWFQLTKTGFKTRSVLTYTLISSLTPFTWTDISDTVGESWSAISTTGSSESWTEVEDDSTNEATTWTDA